MPAIEGPVETETIPRPAVFLHTGWRTAGTWLWSRFRALPWVQAYHEPLHEILGSITPASLSLTHPDTWDSGHPSSLGPYYHEYAALLRPAGGVGGFHPSFSTEDFFADAEQDQPALRAYLQGLIDQAVARGRQPVMKFCRSLGRVAWMRRNFPLAVHVVLLRNPATQFESARRYLARRANAYFLAMPCAILLRHRALPQVADVLGLLGARLPALPSAASQDDVLRASVAWIEAVEPEQRYRMFLAFWLLCVLRLPDCIHGLLDGDQLVLLPRYRARAGADLVAATGLPVTVGDTRPALTLPDRIGVAAADAWRGHQVAAMLMAARHGADWGGTPIGAAVAAMLAHADLVVSPDAAAVPTETLTPLAYLQRLQVRADAVRAELTAMQTAHAWGAITSDQWVADCLDALANS